MARPPSRYPTELELEILKVVWRQGPQSGREVRDTLAQRRELAYTSVMTVLNIMTKKKYLRRSKSGASFVYRAVVSEKAVSRGMLGDLVDRVFDGSSSAVLVNLMEDAELNPGELEKLRKLIDRKTKEKSS